MNAKPLAWRWPNGARHVHISEPDGHRAICGHDVLHAITESECAREDICPACMDEAEHLGLKTPPLLRVQRRPVNNLNLFL